jgi:hypothetical protein
VRATKPTLVRLSSYLIVKKGKLEFTVLEFFVFGFVAVAVFVAAVFVFFFEL